MHCRDKAARHAIPGIGSGSLQNRIERPARTKAAKSIGFGSATHVALPGVGTGVATAACLIAAKSKSRGTRLL
jgi:hypothetical protein